MWRDDTCVDNQTIAELSNQLTVIRGGAELVLGRLASDDPSAREMQSIIDAADDAIALIRGLKSNS
jgi:hypothetical protein